MNRIRLLTSIFIRFVSDSGQQGTGLFLNIHIHIVHVGEY